MGRPKDGYFIDGEKVPGVTTITGRYKDSGALIYWAWNQGKQGIDFRQTRDKAADAGTCAHAMIEADWHQTEFKRTDYEPSILEKADHAFLAYLEWKEQTNLKIIKPELTLLSKKHKFGGTLDAILVGKKLRLGDYKTSGGVYADMLIQVGGGYALLWEENYPDEKLDGIEILRFSKPNQPDDPISFHHHYYSAEILPILKQQFIRFREAYEADKRIKKLL